MIASTPLRTGVGARPYLGLVIATLAVSFSAIFIRLTTSPPLVTASGRMALTVLVLAWPVWRQRRALRALTRRDLAFIGVAGLLLALHFATWTASLFFTTVASSVLFVTVHPVLVAGLDWLLFGERPRRLVWIGITLAVVGSLVLGGGDLRLGGTALLGDLLALAGAAVFAGYLIIGRRLRQRLDAVTYSAPVYAVCTAVLVALALIWHQPFAPLTTRNTLLFVALALVPTLGGHLVYNWTLRYLATALVSVSFLGEPVLAALLAWPLLGQAIAPPTALGGSIVLAGLYLALRA